MSKHRPGRGIATASLAALSLAFGPAARASEYLFEGSAGADQAHYRSTEYRRDGSVFNRESGQLRGPDLHAALKKENWRLRLEWRQLSGSIDYQGQSQFGVPISTDTELTHTQWGATGGYRFDRLPVFVGLAARFRKIDRDIQPTPITQRLRETLTQAEIGPVVGLDWPLSDKTSLTIEALVARTVDSELHVDFFGTYDRGKLEPGRNMDRRVTVELRHALTPSLSLVAGLSGERYSPARSDVALLESNGVPVGTYSYPGSTQEQWSGELGIVFMLGP